MWNFITAALARKIEVWMATDRPLAAVAPVCVWKAGRELGEGSWWSAAEQGLYWIDIKNPAILRLIPSTGEQAIWSLSEMIGCCAPLAGGGLIAGMASGFYRLDLGLPGSEPSRSLVHCPQHHIGSDRFNDGKVHPDGSFWAGSMDDEECATRGFYYRLAPSGEVTIIAGPYKVCNGPAFSPDGRFAYLADSAAQIVHRLDLAAGIAAPEPFLRFTEGEGHPDGCTTDADGRLWIAFWDGARVACFDPETGAQVIEISMPTPRPTSVSFGGPDLTTLYITTARAPADSVHQDGGGSLYAAEIEGARGWPVPQYRPIKELS
ncbi:SMP-30/gluconolactonase/LRE family protein [Novosphingobium fluoreni]|uniref:SMP-30/gluconolactonase/LRE family protein n=1 Tax=Novosphingobium fluoreni TaxID=1391222 RepID=UPI003DA14CAA